VWIIAQSPNGRTFSVIAASALTPAKAIDELVSHAPSGQDDTIEIHRPATEAIATDALAVLSQRVHLRASS
jgi:hypothetical protein